jgi:Transposase DDE domain
MSAKDVRYRVRNWSSYNDSLRKRGSLTVWIDEETIKNWYAIPTGKAVQQFHYSDAAIQLALSLRAIYRLPLRATQGFLQSIFKMMSVKLDVPDYTTICRRAAKQKVTLDCELPKEPMHLAIDSTGLKIFGEGEWKVRIHGVGKRRTWRKLHIGLDVETREIVAAAVTEANVHDSHVLEELTPENGGEVNSIYADGAYDNFHGYDMAVRLVANAYIDPRSGAALATGSKVTAASLVRNTNIRGIWKLGKEAWKAEVSYHKRSLAENGIYRLKTIFGDHMASRKMDRQVTEGRMRTKILNQMTHLGMPRSEKVYI